jgi:hypothetical protein
MVMATTTTSTSSAGPLPDCAGVYVAKPRQLLIGPLVHLERFLAAPTGAAFPCNSTTLPPASLRYVVDCAPHLSDLPPMPDYAMVPSSMMESASSAHEASEAATQQQQQQQAAPPLGPVSPASSVCPASTSLLVAPGSGSDNAEFSPTPSSATTTPASAAPPVATGAAMSTSEVVRRMHKNAEECLERLLQRCVQNGMSTTAFSSVRQANSSFTTSSLASAASSSPSPLRPPLTSKTPQPTSAAEAGFAAPAAHHGDNASSTSRVSALPKGQLELFAQARRNDEMRAAAEATLGADHVLRCLIPDTDDSLVSVPVQDTLKQIQLILQSNPEATVYVYSLDGKGTASALAALYLLEVDRVALSEVLLQRLPACTPRMSCLVQLVERDPHPNSFDKLAYLRLYLARRYPAASAPSIEAAVSTCKGNYAKAEHLVRLDMSFQRVDNAFLPSCESRRSGSAGRASSYYNTESLSDISSTQHTVSNGITSSSGNHNSNNRVANERAALCDGSISKLSLCSSFAKEPLRLTEGDEKIIDSLYRALADSRVGVSWDEVRESYIQHRRAQDAVLRQFLLRFRVADELTTPSRIQPYQAYGYTNSGCATPSMTELNSEIALPSFAPQSTPRRGSLQPASTAAKKASTESCPSPEPKVPSVNATLTPNKTTPKTAIITPQSERQTSTLLATPTVKRADAAGAAPAAKSSASTPASVKKKTRASSLLSSATPAAKQSAATPKTKEKSMPSAKKSKLSSEATAPTSLTAASEKTMPKKNKKCASPKAASHGMKAAVSP